MCVEEVRRRRTTWTANAKEPTSSPPSQMLWGAHATARSVDASTLVTQACRSADKERDVHELHDKARADDNEVCGNGCGGMVH